MKERNETRGRMKKKISICKWMLIAALAVLLGTAGAKNVSAAAKLNCYEGQMYEGKTATLRVTGGTVKSWKSTNTSIATVNSKGVVTAKKKGSCKVYATLTNGQKLICVVNVRSTTYSAYLKNSYAVVMLNILGAVESGGQVYGKRNYAAFAGPGASSPNEYSSTAGAFQEYGENLRQLLLRIQKEYPRHFKQYDTANIANDIKRVWSDSNPYRVYAGTAKAKAIQNIISKKSGARYIQNLRAVELTDTYLKHIRSLGVTNVRAALFMAECEHLGGAKAVERVVRRATNKNDILALWRSLILDQKDTSNSYQIGDKIYQSRHLLCYKWIVQNIPATAKLKK